MPGAPHPPEKVEQVLRLRLLERLPVRKVETETGVSFSQVAAMTRNAQSLLKPDLAVEEQLPNIARQIASRSNGSDEKEDERVRWAVEQSKSEPRSERIAREIQDALDQRASLTRRIEALEKAIGEVSPEDEDALFLRKERGDQTAVEKLEARSRLRREREDLLAARRALDRQIEGLYRDHQAAEGEEREEEQRERAKRRLESAAQIGRKVDELIEAVSAHLGICREMYAKAGDEYRGGGNRAHNLFGRRQLYFYLTYRLSQLMPGGDWPRLDPALRPIYGRPFVEIERDILRQWLDGEGEEGEDETGETDFATAEADEVDPIEGDE